MQLSTTQKRSPELEKAIRIEKPEAEKWIGKIVLDAWNVERGTMLPSISIRKQKKFNHSTVEGGQQKVNFLPRKVTLRQSDSRAISWIDREPRELDTFVANRVSKIQERSSCDL
ncbi:hypothetical protein CEXT_46291 [Caerostris extrusa]|uniref:Uncharacterized protein n=1 Tax=Caerostris extrusa TaxID=172846 RepID=A0AAV4RHY4_CAEEX|nr:hypothetical protein CEXT_46291 [Caerostris extrusa]